MINKIKKVYYELISTSSDEECDKAFIGFLDSAYNVLMSCFVIFASISVCFFVTRELLWWLAKR